MRDRTAIVGVGSTDYSRNSGVSTQTLALRAITRALADAGLSPDQVDGLACHRVGDSVDPAQIAQALGLRDLAFLSDAFGGGSTSMSVLGAAAMAVATGAARCVVCWRALNARSGLRMGGFGASLGGDAQYWVPYHHMTPPQLFAMHAREFMHARHLTAEDLGRVAINQRANASLNPQAMMRDPLTMEQYLASRWIVEPFRLFDCCLETDAAVALVVTSADRAPDLRHPPVTISAVTWGAGYQLTSNGVSDRTRIPARLMAPRLYAAAGVGPGDLDVAELYDAFTSLVLVQLEAYQLCEEGDAAAMVADGGTALGGEIPVNTHGGHLSEGYVHGLNHVVEAVHQLRHDCGPRQVAGAEVALVASQPGIYSGVTGAAILRRG